MKVNNRPESTVHGGDASHDSTLPRTADRGIISIEFALVVPMMLLVLLGFTEIYMYIRAVSIVEHTAFTIADSIGQMPDVINTTSTSDANSLGSIWNAATLLAAPNTLQANGAVVITSICDLTQNCIAPSSNCVPPILPPLPPSLTPGAAQMYWQAKAPWNQGNMTSLETATNLLPSSWPFRTGDSAIVVEVFYSYNPFTMTSAFWPGAPGTQTIYERVYVRQRFGQALALEPSTCA